MREHTCARNGDSERVGVGSCFISGSRIKKANTKNRFHYSVHGSVLIYHRKASDDGSTRSRPHRIVAIKSYCSRRLIPCNTGKCYATGSVAVSVGVFIGEVTVLVHGVREGVSVGGGEKKGTLPVRSVIKIKGAIADVLFSEVIEFPFSCCCHVVCEIYQ